MLCMLLLLVLLVLSVVKKMLAGGCVGLAVWLQQLTAGLRKLLVLPRGGSLLRLSL